jgi:ornithine cyclodeaminase
MGLMPSFQAGTGYGLKAITVTPGNPAAGLDSHQGIVLLSSEQAGQPLAVLNASAVTEIRTAAVSAVATDLLAAPGADVLAIVGTGVQARSHLMAIAATVPLTEVRIAGSGPARAAGFAADVAPAALAEVGVTSVRVTACDSAKEAVDGAGIVVTATTSPVPVLERGWLAPGTHINAVGACLPHARELDTETVASAALFADSRESVLAESGDYLLAAADGAIGPDHVRAEIGDLLASLAPGRGRRQHTEITIFESLGLAIEDLAAAAAAYEAARETGAGSWLEFG